MGIAAAGAQAATINVGCSDNLASAITTANGTTAADVIEITGAPCTFTITTPAVVSSGNNYALPIVTQPLTIDGNGSTIQRSSSATVPFRILGSTVSLTLNDLTIKGGSLTATGQGGAGVVALLPAASTLTLNRDTFTGNATTGANSSGGAVGQIGGGLTINDSTFTANSVKLNGGAVYAQTAATQITTSSFGDGTAANANASASGGAVYTTGGSLLLDRDRIVGNGALAGGGTFTLQTAATIRRTAYVLNTADNTAGAVVTGGIVNFENDTFSTNTAGWFNISNPNNIGGIAVLNSGAVSGIANVASTTIANSGRTTAPTPGGALVTGVGAGGGTATINVTDTIVTDTDSTVATPPTGVGNYKQCDTTLGGTINNQGGNVQWPQTTCGFGTNADPLLKPFDTTTLSYGLQPTSPAIDLGGATGPATDQLGATRPAGDGFDAGAIEAPLPQTFVDPVVSPTNAPSVTFHSDITGATFECRIDGAVAFAACTSPFSPTLSDGSHTVFVRAIAGGYTDPSPASVTFVVDTTPPVVTITSAPAALSNDNTPTVAFTVDDGSATVSCTVDSASPVTPCNSPFAPGALLDGAHTIVVTATDAAGNPGSATANFTIDTTPPDTTITSGPSGTINTASATFGFSADESGVTFECRLDTDTFAPCSSPTTVSGYTSGTHTFEVRATDAAGNVETTAASRTFNYVISDTTPPETTITSGPSGTIYDHPSSTFTFTSSESGSTFECRLDAAAFTACSSPATVSYAPGTHTFQVRATDAAGNTDPTPASQTFTYTKCSIIRLTLGSIVICL